MGAVYGSKQGRYGKVQYQFLIFRRHLRRSMFVSSDELWFIVISLLSYIDRIQLGRTCKKFHYLANDSDFMRRAKKHLSDIFVVPIERDFGREFCAAFANYFRQHYRDPENILYMKNFLTIVREHLTSRFLFGQLYWCQRNTNLKNQCKFCCLVRKCYILDKSEKETRYHYVLYHYQKYNEHHERIFEENDFFLKDLNRVFKKCQPFEYVYSYNQLVNLFGIVAVRVFSNIGKNYFFVGRFNYFFVGRFIFTISFRFGQKDFLLPSEKILANSMLATQFII